MDTELSGAPAEALPAQVRPGGARPIADTPALREALGGAAADLLAETQGPIGQRDRSAGRAVVIRTGRAGSRRRAAG